MLTGGGGRGPSNPRRLRVPHSPALFLALQLGKIPVATLPVLWVRSSQRIPPLGPAEQPSGPVDVTDKVSSPSRQLRQSHRTAPPLPTLLLNFPPPSSTCLQLGDIPRVRCHPKASHSPGTVQAGRWKSTGSTAGSSCCLVGGQPAFPHKSSFPAPKANLK